MSQSPKGKTMPGYIVTTEGHPMWAENRKTVAPDEQGVLYIGYRAATVFPTRARAKRAIQRTRDYAAINALRDWTNSYDIVRLEGFRG